MHVVLVERAMKKSLFDGFAGARHSGWRLLEARQVMGLGLLRLV